MNRGDEFPRFNSLSLVQVHAMSPDKTWMFCALRNSCLHRGKLACLVMRKIDKCKITIEIFPSRHDIFKCSAIPDGRTDGQTERQTCSMQKEGQPHRVSRQAGSGSRHVRSSTCKNSELAERSQNQLTDGRRMANGCRGRPLDALSICDNKVASSRHGGMAAWPHHHHHRAAMLMMMRPIRCLSHQ